MEEAMDLLRQKHPFITVYSSYELDSRDKIHTHSMIETPRKIFIKRFNLPGYTICCRPIWFEAGWEIYAYKLNEELDAQYRSIMEDIKRERELESFWRRGEAVEN